MNKSLEIKKLEVELKQVDAARAAIELRIEEFLAQVEDLKKYIDVQLLREEELKEKLKEMRK